MNARESNRAAMPKVAAIVDLFRAEFGELRVIYASENGIERGKRDHEVTTPLPDDLSALRERRAA